MGDKMRRPGTPQPSDHDYELLHLSSQNAATPYSSGAEGVLTDFTSSRGTSYGSPEQSWNMDRGIHHQGGYYGHSGVTHYPPNAYPYPTQRNDIPVARNTRASPASRKATSSPASSKGRKPKNAKSGKLNDVTLEAPLSVLTKDSKVPLKDMETFVNRSTEERMKEKEKKNGYIVRPMNAFMLYRSAYADRAKSLFDQNNHQVVSKTTGQSWRMESKEINQYYKTLSEIERENHQKAWPNYKFSPSKSNNAAARKRKGNGLESEDDGTEQDPSDLDWTPSGARKPRPTRQGNRGYEREQDFGSPYSNPQLVYGSPLNRPEYAYPNPGRPAPQPMEEYHGLDLGNPYYPQHMRPYSHGLEYDGIHSESHHPSYMISGPGELPPGLPGASQNNLFDMPFMGDQDHPQYGMLDPKLESFGPVHSNGMFTEDSFANYHEDMLAQQGQHRYPQRQHVESTQSGDASDPSILEILSNDPEGFQKWVEHENQS